MAISKVAYDGHTLIDLTGDTAVAADVAQGKTFHLANGEQATGTNTGGITPTGTINITANGTYDVTSYAAAAVNVPAVTPSFPYACTLKITLDNYLDADSTFDLDVCYRGGDPDNPSTIVWRTVTYHFTGVVNEDTHVINLVANPEGQYNDGIYIPVGDGGTESNITSAINCMPQYTTDNGTTGSEVVYLTISGNNASCVVYVSNL